MRPGKHVDDPETWREQADCLGVDPDLFYPRRGESTAEAKAVCQACPVRAACLEYALTSPLERHGIWGGLSERERRRLRQQRRTTTAQLPARGNAA